MNKIKTISRDCDPSKEIIVKKSIVLLALVFSFGLFQAWKEARNPFAFFTKESQIASTKPTENNKNYVEIMSKKL